MTPANCPNCGADVPRKARACPECGACEKTGWSEAADSDGLDLPEASFDYEDFVKREFEDEGRPAGSNSKGKRLWIGLVAFILVVILMSRWL